MRRLFVLVSAVVLVDTMFFAAIVPLLPEYRTELGLSKAQAGLLTAAYPAGTLAMAIPSAWVVARIGARGGLLTGLALLSLSSFAFAFGQTIWVLDPARFLQGVGGALAWTSGLAWLIGTAPPDRRGAMIGSALAAAVAGVVLGPVLGGAATVTSPELVFSLVGVVGVGLAIATLATPPVTRVPAPPLRDVLAALRSRPILAGIALVGLPALFSGLLDVLAPLRLDELGVSGLVIGAVFLTAAAVEATMSPFVGRFSDRHGRLATARYGLPATAAIAVALPLAGTAWLESALVIAAVAALATFWAPAMALLSDSVEAVGLQQAFAFAITNLAWAGGQVLGGAGGSGLADATADAVPYSLLACLCLAALVSVARAGPARRPTP